MTRLEKLREMVIGAGGPAAFVRRYSRLDADKPIDASYISQLLNGHRNFGENAAKAMAKRMGYSEDFFSTADTPSATNLTSSEKTNEYGPDIGILTVQEKTLLMGFRAMGEEGRDLLMQQAMRALETKKEADAPRRANGRA